MFRRHIVCLCFSLPVLLLAASCTGSSTVDINLTNPNFPSSSEASGSDALSSSTNYAQKAFDPKQKADPLAGAAYIPVPQMNNYGGLNFSYKIDVPEGRAGVEPKIALSYSSSGGDGWTGIGWNIGMGAITRTTRYGQLFYDQNDIFTYSGKRLYRVSGPVGSQNGVYRLEIDDGSMARFELTNAESGGTWIVYGADGSATAYGANLTERITLPTDVTKTYAWQFSQTTDRNGNFLQALYDTTEYAANHILYLKELRYTGNAGQGMPANQFVRFNLKDRSDYYISRAAGFSMKMTKLLDTIEVGWDMPGGSNNKVLWSYQLDYVTSPDSNRPLLSTIHSTRNTTRPIFQYQPASNTLAWQQVMNVFASDPQINPQITQYVEGDFNGDGKSDFCFFNPETGDWKVVESSYTGGYAFKTYGNKFKGYKGQSQIQFFKGNVTGDFNADGKSDIAMYLPQTKEFWVAESTGTNFNFKLYGKFVLTSFDIMKAEWFTGDYNGDGLSDILLFSEDTGDWIMMQATGTQQSGSMMFSFNFLKIGNQFQYLFRNDYNGNATYGIPSTKDNSPLGSDRGKIQFFSGDFNGDGRSDIAFYDQRSGKWWASSIDAQITQNIGVTGYNMSWQVFSVFSTPQQTLFAMDRFSGDFNGDGLTDFLILDRANNVFWLGATIDSMNGQPPTITFRIWSSLPSNVATTRWFQGDFNGDGRTDVAFYSATDNNIWVGEATPSGLQYRIYNNLGYGGPNASVLANAPLPIDDITITDATQYTAFNGATQKVQYVFDGNPNTNRGELPFLGCFTTLNCDSQPELLVYDRKSGGISLVKGGNKYNTGLIISSASNQQLVTQRQPVTYTRNNAAGQEILYYASSQSAGSTNIQFNAIRVTNNNGTYTYDAPPIAKFISNSQPANTQITNFDLNSSLYAFEYFDIAVNSAQAAKKLLVLDDQAVDAAQKAAPAFKLIDQNGTVTPLTLSGALLQSDLANLLTQGNSVNRLGRPQIRIFTRPYDTTSQTSYLFIIDMRTPQNKWYVGGINATAKTIIFNNLAVNGVNTNLPINQGEQFPENPSLQKIDAYTDSVFYVVKNPVGVSFNRIGFTLGTGGNPTAQIYQYGIPGTDTSFNWEFDNNNRPLVHNANGTQSMAFSGNGTSYTLTTILDTNISVLSIDRSDLYQNVYPVNWIQGDYNGDSKTDIGFFSLKENNWYFALTTGTVPDLISSVDNGIGGNYQFTYANSTSFDNRDTNGISQLPMNYKVCTQVQVSDGQGHYYYNQYQYLQGFAVSSYQLSAIATGVGQAMVGRKETDYFGFSLFTAIDGLGSRTINTYNRAPYTPLQGADFYLKNRALSGALQQSQFLGWDNKEYSRTTYQYDVKSVVILGAQSGTYFPVQTQSQKYVQNVLTQSSATNVTLVPATYATASRTSSSADLFADAAHPSQTLTNTTNYERLSDTNQERPTTAVSLVASPSEVTTAYSYDSNGNLSQQVQTYTGTGLTSVAPRSIVYQYDGYGNRTSTTNTSDTPARRSEYVYDNLLQQYVAQEKLIGDAVVLTQTIDYNYDVAFGSPSSIADANNNKKYISYDTFGRITQVNADTEQGVQTLSDFSYSLVQADNTVLGGTAALWAKTTQHTGIVTAMALSYDIKTRVFKDGIGREIQTLQSALDMPAKHFVKSGRRLYDALGRVIAQSQAAWAGDDEFDALEMSVPASDKNPTLTQYDASGRVGKVTLPPAYTGEPETSVTTTYNDPWEVISVHSIGQGKRTVSNARGHTLYLDDFSNADGLRTKMGFCYDIAGNRVKRSDLNTTSLTCGDSLGENVSTWTFDAFGQLKTVNDPDTGTTQYSYTAFGEVTIKTDSLGRSTTLIYDRLGRATQKNPNGEGLVTYTYDTASNGLGRLATMDDAAQTKNFRYDKLGHRNAETRKLKIGNTAVVYETLYRYDYLDRTYEIDYPTNPVDGSRARVCYAYNGFASISTVTALPLAAGLMPTTDGCLNAKPIVQNIDYNEFGQILQFGRGNGISSIYEYDIRGRITKLSTDRNGTRFVDKVYTYNVLNSIEDIQTSRTSAAMNANFLVFDNHLEYDYDGLNRLVAARGIASPSTSSGQPAPGSLKKFELNYRYALNGNLTDKIVSDYDTHTAQDHWYYTYTNHKASFISTDQQGGNRFIMAYDAAGNTTSKTDAALNLTKLMSYDSQNRITSVTNQTTSEVMGQYSYDDQGFRVYKKSRQTTNSQTSIYELETPNKYFAVERQKDLSNNPIPNTDYAVNNIFLNGVRIAAMVSTGQARWFMTDQVDSVNVVTNDNGDAISAIDYLPYGETWYEQGDTGFSPKYNSQDLDKESGLYFFNARHYDPEIARFETADSVVDGEMSVVGWNRYTYVHGNPIMYKDPTGHWTWGGVWDSVKSAVGLGGDNSAAATQPQKAGHDYGDSGLGPVSKAMEVDASALNTLFVSALNNKAQSLGNGKSYSINQVKIVAGAFHAGGPSKGSIKNVAGNWYAAQGDFFSDPNALKTTPRPGCHYICGKNDERSKADIQTKAKDSGLLFAPDFKFKVIEAGAYRDWGNYVKIRYTDKNNNIVDAQFGHLNIINSKILDSINAGGNGPEIDGGTLIGANLRDIGLSEGPHTHSMGTVKGNPRWLDRDALWNSLTGQ